jgi:hypothetical protein
MDSQFIQFYGLEMKHVNPNDWKNTHENYNERFKLLYERCYDAWLLKWYIVELVGTQKLLWALAMHS